ncbi:hypothetical protein NHF46_02475 [Arthrobacter alpinus]|nr:hypothetical protein [Arthrobacter alpinus]
MPWLELLNANAGIVEKPFEASAAEVSNQPFGGASSYVRGLDWEDLLTAGRNSSAEGAFHHAVMVHARASTSAGTREWLRRCIGRRSTGPLWQESP